MDPEKTVQERKKRLVLSLETSRRDLASGAQDLQHRLNPVRQFGAHFRRHPLHLFGATVAGAATLTSLLRTRKRRKKKPKSFKRALLGMAFLLAKPAIRLWVLDQTRAYLQSQHTKRQTDSLLGP